MPDLETGLRSVIGAKTATALARGLDLHTAGDLLRHYPRRYATRGEHTDISALVVGEQATVLAQVINVRTRPMRQRRGSLLEVTVGESAGTGFATSVRSLTVTFFNQAWRARELVPGEWGLFAGKVSQFRGAMQLQQPEYRLLDAAPTDAHGLSPTEPSGGDAEHPNGADESADALEQFAGALIPVYPATSSVPTWVISRCVRVVLDVVGELEDPLPETLRQRQTLTDLTIALRDIHRPSSMEAKNTARERLAFDEALSLQLVLAQRRRAGAERNAIARSPHVGGLLAAFDASLPFELTAGQAEVGKTIAGELASTTPMHRLLQGDVGSGKTLVALRAMLQVVDAGGQAAMLAPTEVLAAQHAQTIRDALGPFGRAGELGAAEQATKITLLTGSMSATARRQALAEIAGDPGVERAGIVIGTHALLQETVAFSALGLIVIDEQHRFGVEQRDALRGKAGESPAHVLVMTATPIPRTVAMTVYGDLDVSLLTELPAGRTPIASTVVAVAEQPAWVERAWQRVREEVAAGHQVYIVCPRIGGDDEPDDEEDHDRDVDEPDAESLAVSRRPPVAALDVAARLSSGPLAGLTVGVLHGRLSADQKDAVMSRFVDGSLAVLVATTIVEVGVNVPNATMMVICDADRFGVSQLHQLRGRVGRGTAPGLCLLMTEAAEASAARERLEAVASTVDGFRLAQLDLEQRREGDVLGAAQSGRRSSLKLLSLLRDAPLITRARDLADQLVREDPRLSRYPMLALEVTKLVDAEQADYLEKH